MISLKVSETDDVKSLLLSIQLSVEFNSPYLTTIADKTHETLCILEEIESRDAPHPPPPLQHCNVESLNVIDEFTSMSSSSNQHCNGGEGALAVKGSSLSAGKACWEMTL